MIMQIRKISILLSLLLASSCGPTVKLAPDLPAELPRTVALLPVASGGDVRRERVDYLERALRRELDSVGFVVLDAAPTVDLCADSRCSRRSELASKYGVQGLLTFDIESAYRANIIAGYVNTIHGTLRLFSASSKELASVDHTERERGGLLFNSGQVLEGLRSTSDNFGDESFNRLADRFVKTLVDSLPKPKGTGALSQLGELNLSGATSTGLGGGRFEVCAVGSAGGRAFVNVDRTRIPLREVQPGKYCSALLLGGLVRPGSRVVVELRSPFGVAKTTDLESKQFLLCDLNGLLQLTAGPTVRFGCSESGSSPKGTECAEWLQQCRGTELVVYRGAAEGGPFERLGVMSAPTWTDSAPRSEAPVYAVVAVSSNGARSSLLTINR